MKRFSWEIVVAGMVFVFVAIYLMGRPTQSSSQSSTNHVPDPPEPPTSTSVPTNVQVIDLENLDELHKLEELKKLENLEQLGKLETLQSLKEMARFIPEETRDEFISELDLAIQDLSTEEVQISVNLDDNIIVLNKNANLVLGSWIRTSPGVYTFKNEFSATGVTSVSATLPSGNITVIGTNDSTTSFTLQASGQINNDDQLADIIVPNSSIENGELELNITSDNGFNNQNIQLQATLYVPENAELSSTTKAGHIEITNVHGDQVHETGGGHIKLHKVSGDVVAVTRGGHMWMDNGSGELTLKSSGGHLNVKEFDGDISLKTAGGNILIEEVDGEISCATSGGNIDIKLTKADQDITAESSAGNIKMSLPSNLSAEIDIKGSNGVEVSGYTLSTESKSRNAIKGEINGGRSDIVAYTKYGNVAIKSND